MCLVGERAPHAGALVRALEASGADAAERVVAAANATNQIEMAQCMAAGMAYYGGID